MGTRGGGPAADFLIDKSAIVRFALNAHVQELWQPAIDAGLIAICSMTELEMHFSARSVADDEEMTETLRAMFPWVPMADDCFERARTVQNALVKNGTHRSAGPVDLVIAATAERHGLTVLHDDKDFDRVARITGQPVERIGEV